MLLDRSQESTAKYISKDQEYYPSKRPSAGCSYSANTSGSENWSFKLKEQVTALPFSIQTLYNLFIQALLQFRIDLDIAFKPRPAGVTITPLLLSPY